VDGFRLDAVATLFVHPELPDHGLPLAPGALLNANDLGREEYGELLRHQLNQPGLHELMRELRALVETYPGDRVLVAEDEDVAYHGAGDDELQLVFNFPLMRAPRMTPAHIRANQARRLAELPPGAWPCNTLGNHDAPRLWSRYGDGAHDGELARLNAALMLTLKGTPFLYNGEELGMTDLELTSMGQLRDRAALSQYHALTQGRGMPPAEAFKAVALTTRDRCRSPMQWSGGPNGGFCPPGVAPWLPVNPNAATGVNVAAQEADPSSLLHFYRRMLRLRRATPALVAGAYEALEPASPDLLAFLRRDPRAGQVCLVALNYSAAPQAAGLALDEGQARLRFSSHARADGPLALDGLTLAPFEVLVAELR
jgi:alpha-glucosidase